VNNKITIFSNGIADFIQNYEIKKDDTKEISLAVKSSHVGDILASLNVYGNVKLTSPPSFKTVNSEDALSLASDNVLVELATKLSGAEIILNRIDGEVVKCNLCGIHKETSEHREITSLVCKAGNQFLAVPLDDISNFEFTDVKVQEEVKKAFAANLQSIKPDGTFVKLSLLGVEDSNVEIQYSVPAAAWKISYRLNCNDIVAFKGLAIVDNNTEDDWKDVIVSVVTGEPITFSTDLAQAKTPKRNHINVVQDRAEGAIEVETISEDYGGGRGMASLKRSVGLAAMPSSASISPGIRVNALESMEAKTEIKEVGDYSVFTAKDLVSIDSNNSAIIPVFDATLENAKTVLHYKQSNNPTRPYRSIQFKNETEHSLGRGVCTVNIQGMYAGSCIIPALKQGQEQLLPYALETGVKITADQQFGEAKVSRLSGQSGQVTIEDIQKIETTYKIQNLKKETFELYLDYDNLYDSKSIICKIDDREIEGKREGSIVRYDLQLAPQSVTQVIVVETKVDSVTRSCDGWFCNQYKGYLANLENLGPALTLIEQYKDLEQDVKNRKKQADNLTKKQDRLRANLAAVSEDKNKVTASWVQELVTNEAALTKLEDDDIPGLELKLKLLNKKIDKALNDVSFDLKT